MLSVTQKTSQVQDQSTANPPAAKPAASGFGGVLRAEQVSGTDAQAARVVRRGDTLIGMVKQHASSFGVQLNDHEAMRQALDVAKTNGIRNPNLIFPGQSVDFSTLDRGLQARATPATSSGTMPSPYAASDSLASTQAALRTRPIPAERSEASILSQTLQRAVDKGYISQAEQNQVQSRILKLASDLNFDPDDFAHVAMMESDGLNPKATNGQCHGIIQFCEGPDRGAASVNKAGEAASIRDMSVLEQLDLVEAYFRDVGLGGSGPKLKLDDLYLSVLTPAARAYQEPHQALPIRGTQAAALHIDGQRSRPITRQSIVQGLILNSQDRLAASRIALEARQSIALAPPLDAPEEILTGDASPAANERQHLAARASQASNSHFNRGFAGQNQEES